LTFAAITKVKRPIAAMKSATDQRKALLLITAAAEGGRMGSGRANGMVCYASTLYLDYHFADF